MHIFVMEPYRFTEQFTIVEATRHQLGNGSRERNEGRFRAFDVHLTYVKMLHNITLLARDGTKGVA